LWLEIQLVLASTKNIEGVILLKRREVSKGKISFNPSRKRLGQKSWVFGELFGFFAAP
jgi:hypothetical protein